MAIYHLSVQVIGRSAGRSAVAAAAYRAGERLVDERTGQVHDYSRRRGIESEILAPAQAPAWIQDRERLWNAVEASERRKDSQLAREINIALPLELSREQARELVRGYVQEQFVAQGMVADVAYHWDRHNPHVHVMLTLRAIGPDGFGAKVREWNRTEALEGWREAWERHANRALERAGRSERIDHRSLEAQGITDRLPTIHEGPHVRAMARRGLRTERAAIQAAIREHNATVVELDRLRRELEGLRLEQRVRVTANHRVAQGWDPANAERVAAAERLLGRTVATRRELAEALHDRDRQLRDVEAQLARIQREGDRLVRAGEALARYEAAAAEVQRLEGLAGRLWRLVNPRAREAYAAALDRREWAAQALREHGVADRADYDRQRLAWQQEHARLPRLQSAREHLARDCEVLRGAVAAALREQQRLRAREHQRGAQAKASRRWERER